MSQCPFVLLDRDGTVIEELGYLSDPERVRLLPDSAAALRSLRAIGCGLAVMTNQAGVGRGLFDLQTLNQIHARMISLLETEGVALDGIYVCTHHPDEGCPCRKPRLGLLEQAVREFGFDPRASFVIGDKAIDIEFGKNAGATTVLVRTGYGAAVEREGAVLPDYVCDDLGPAAEIIRWIISRRAAPVGHA